MLQESCDEKLIYFVHENPALWNKRLKDYKNVQKKETMWSTIDNRLGWTYGESKTRFKALREKYRREKNIIIGLEKASTDNFRQKWHLMPMLEFLDEVFVPRNFRSLSQSDPKFQQPKQESFNNKNEFSEDYADTSYILSDSESNRKYNDIVEPHIEHLLQQPNRSEKITSFCQYLADELRDLPRLHTEELMDNITLQLLGIKKQLRLQAIE